MESFIQNSFVKVVIQYILLKRLTLILLTWLISHSTLLLCHIVSSCPPCCFFGQGESLHWKGVANHYVQACGIAFHPDCHFNDGQALHLGTCAERPFGSACDNDVYAQSYMIVMSVARWICFSQNSVQYKYERPCS